MRRSKTGLRQDLLRNVYAYGFERPSAIQQCAILPILDGRDVFLEGPSGVGKTTALIIGCMASVDCSLKRCQALVLCVTRELAHAIRHVCTRIDRKIESHLLVGGASVRDDIQALQNGQHLIVGTPGRSHGMISRGFLDTSTLKLIILDEFPELLRRGFADQLSSIFSALAPDIQVCANSDTQEPAMSAIPKLMRNQVVLRMVKDPVTLEDIRQFYLDVDAEQNKLDALRDLFENLPVTQAVVCCNTRRKCDFLQQHSTVVALQLRGYALFSLHADLDSREREAALRSFSSTSKAVLLCSDLVASALPSLPTRAIFINFDLPRDRETYPRRVGCARNRGVVINLVTPDTMQDMREIEAFYGIAVEELPLDIAELL